MTSPTFHELFGGPPDVTADAPGRVNLIGEHTDYNGGFVMPSALPQRTSVALARRRDDRVRVVSAELGEDEFRLGQEARRGTWIDYVQGMTHALADVAPLSGFNALVRSDVPMGSGLSSSAALEIAVGRALRNAFALEIDDIQLARAGQRAEHELAGAPVGIMDQIASSLGNTQTALFLDTRSLEYEYLPLVQGSALVVVHSGTVHRHASGEYAQRRTECHQAAAQLGVAELRDVDPAEMTRIEALPEPLNRRARHVVTENARVLAAVDAMRRGDVRALGALFFASHASLRDDFEVSVPAIDTMVEIARRTAGVHGARLTGGGFGGSVVIIADADVAASAAASIAAEYHAPDPSHTKGRDARVIVRSVKNSLAAQDFSPAPPRSVARLKPCATSRRWEGGGEETGSKSWVSCADRRFVRDRASR